MVCISAENPGAWWGSGFGGRSLGELVAATNAPVVPIRVSEAIGDSESLLRHITVEFGEPLASSVSPEEIAATIAALGRRGRPGLEAATPARK